MELRSCLKWESCNASLCPLGWDEGKAGEHLQGEKVCPLALELVKDGGPERVRSTAPEMVVLEIQKVLPAVSSAYSDIAKKLKRAAGTGSRIERTRLLRPKTVVPHGGNCAETGQDPTEWESLGLERLESA